MKDRELRIEPMPAVPVRLQASNLNGYQEIPLSLSRSGNKRLLSEDDSDNNFLDTAWKS